MSRSVRRKYKATPAKSRRRGSETTVTSIDLSDDEGYSAVEDISDSEDDDEEDVNAVEEENLITEAIQLPSPSPRPSVGLEHGEEDDGEDEAEDVDIDDEDDDDDDDDDDDQDEDGDEHASWAGIPSEAEEGHAADFYQEAMAFSSDVAERHVRFDVPDSDSDSTDTDDDHADLFPDIFVSQTSLDPAFRREIEDDPDDDSSGSASFWDYTNYNANNDEEDEEDDDDADELIRTIDEDETPKANRVVEDVVAVETLPTFVAAEEFDGYETDGDTTEEEDNTPEPPVRKRSRRPSMAKSEATDSEDESPVKNERGQPRIGRFNLDRSEKKPIAVLNPLTRKMMIFTPHRRRQLDLSPEQFNFSTWNLEETASPLLSNSANMMLSAMFSTNTFGDFVNAQTMGPAEAFFPFPSDGVIPEGSSSPRSMEEEDDDAEKNLDISDFITWDDDGPSDDEESVWPPSSTPIRPTTASSELDVLGHLNSETVGAFRRNQINQQLILSNQATQDSLAFSGPYNYTAIKGLKSDRFDTAGIPLTPVRRQRNRMQDARSPLETVSAKRKASNDANNRHKKQRSISDVNLLRI